MTAAAGRSAQLVLAGLILIGLSFSVRMSPAAAQDGRTTASTDVKAPTKADIELEVGDYDASLNDWPVTAVTVTGDIEADVVFTVILSGRSGELWTATSEFTSPKTRLTVDTPVAVGEVTEAKLGTTLVLGQLITPELGEGSQPGGLGGSTGQVATTMALVIIIVVILFRTPLPAATVQRWTR